MLTPARTDHENFHIFQTMSVVEDSGSKIEDRRSSNDIQCDHSKRILATNEHESSRIRAKEWQPTVLSRSERRFVFIRVHSWLKTFSREPYRSILISSLDSSRRRKLRLWFAPPSPLLAWRPNRPNKSYQAKVRRRVLSLSSKGR